MTAGLGFKKVPLPLPPQAQKLKESPGRIGVREERRSDTLL